MTASATKTHSMTKAERFEEFHENNGHVYTMLVGYCREWAQAGHTSFGVRAPWERMRWQVGVRTTSADYKLNDHLCPFYARLIAAQEPDLANLLSFRESEADEWIDGYLARTDYSADGALFALFPQGGG